MTFTMSDLCRQIILPVWLMSSFFLQGRSAQISVFYFSSDEQATQRFSRMCQQTSSACWIYTRNLCHIALVSGNHQRTFCPGFSFRTALVRCDVQTFGLVFAFWSFLTPTIRLRDPSIFLRANISEWLILCSWPIFVLHSACFCGHSLPDVHTKKEEGFIPLSLLLIAHCCWEGAWSFRSFSSINAFDLYICYSIPPTVVYRGRVKLRLPRPWRLPTSSRVLPSADFLFPWKVPMKHQNLVEATGRKILLVAFNLKELSLSPKKGGCVRQEDVGKKHHFVFAKVIPVTLQISTTSPSFFTNQWFSLLPRQSDSFLPIWSARNEVTGSCKERRSASLSGFVVFKWIILL